MDETVPTLSETVGLDIDEHDPPTTESGRAVAGETPGPSRTDSPTQGREEVTHAGTIGVGYNTIPSLGSGGGWKIAAVTDDAEPIERPVMPGYEILGELGRGGMGVVYLARQVRLQRPCALKMILAGHHAGTDASARFLAEAETVAKLRHPNIVQIYAIGDYDGRPYIELEYVEGGSLAQTLDGTPWAPIRAAVLVERLARAMGEAHRLGVVHRDIKPGNVLLAADGTPKLADFGLAKTINADSNLTHSGAIMGTPSYMAPEQAEGNAKALGPAADIYALGAILYQLLTGRPPFRGATVIETLQQVKSVEPVAPARLVPGLPRDIETIALKCLQKDPARRYESAAALADDLSRFLAGEPIVARPVGAVERAWRWCRRNPSLAGSLSAAAAALVAVAVLGVLFAGGQAKSRKRIEVIRQDFEKSVATSNQRLAAIHFERGQIAFEKGQTGQGLLWMIETWRSAVAGGDRGWQHTARANLAAWQGHDIAVKMVASHQGEVMAVAFSPDGKAVLTGGEDNRAQLWDAATGEPVGSAMTHQGKVKAVAFSPDGKAVLTGSEDKSVRLWDATTGKAIAPTLEHKGGVASVAFSPDGKAILTGGEDNAARLWDAASGTPIGPPLEHNGEVKAVAFSPDGKTLLTGSSDNTARLWDAASGTPIGPPLEHNGEVRAVAFSPDGKAILTGGEDRTARLWDAATGKPIGPTLAHRDAVSAVAFSPDGKTLLTGSSDRTARLWDTATGKPIGPTLTHTDGVTAVAFSPDGKAILTGSLDNMARLWDAASGKPIGPPSNHQHSVETVAFSPDGKVVITGSRDNTARLWDADTGKPVGPLLQHESWITTVAFSPDGKTVITGSHDHTARLWHAGTGKPNGPPLAHQGAVTAVAFSPDSKSVLTGSHDHTARLWDAATGTLIASPLTHTDAVGAVTFSPDGKTLLTGGDDKTARLWDAATGKPIGPPLAHKDKVRAVAFSPDGKTVITGSHDHTARLWHVATGKPIGARLAHMDAVRAVAFSPDGEAVITGSDDKTARLWDADTGKPIGPPLEHQGLVRAVAFSPDGKAVLTGSDDKTAQLWDTATGKPIGPPLEHHDWVTAVAFSPDGKAVLTGSLDKTARVWRIDDFPDDLPRLTTWVAVVTGLELDEQGLVRTLDNTTWRQRRDQLDRQGGPPETGGKWHLDPILFGSEPTARARAWIQRARWAEAETAFNEVVVARPFDTDVLLERARFHAARSRPDKADDDLVRAYALGSRDSKLVETISRNEGLFHRAVAQVPDSAAMLWRQRGNDHARMQRWADAAADYGQAVRLQPEVLANHQRQSLSQWAAGYPVDELCRVNSTLLGQLGSTTDPLKSNSTAGFATLFPASGVPVEPMLRLAEIAVTGALDAGQKAVSLNTLGAALYRAGRFEDAVRRLEESLQLRNGIHAPKDWAFLAMSHQRLGHRDQAVRNLERLSNRQPSRDPNQFWDELEIRLLENEAEATILYDPLFPADPFRR